MEEVKEKLFEVRLTESNIILTIDRDTKITIRKSFFDELPVTFIDLLADNLKHFLQKEVKR